VALLNDPLTWTEAVGFLYYGGTWQTPQEVIEHLFVPLARDWDGFKAGADSFVSEGDAVVAFGAYSGVNRATGRTFSVAFAHHWHVKNDRIVSFRHYTDMLLVQAAVRSI
jgi:ketosteroid isomerase-like protein